MRGQHLQAGEFVERTVEDQVLQRDGGGQRIADRVGQPAVALPPLVQFRHALRMNEQHGPQFFGLFPDRVEPGIGKFISRDRIADGGTFHPLLFHRGFKLFHRQGRILQRQRREGREPVRLRCDQFRQFFVLDRDDLFAKVAIGVIPERIDRQHLHIDSLEVHALDTLVDDDPCVGTVVDRRGQCFGGLFAHQVRGLMEQAMGMHVDGPDPLAVDADRAPSGFVGLCSGRVRQAAAAEHQAGRGGRFGQEVAT